MSITYADRIERLLIAARYLEKLGVTPIGSDARPLTRRGDEAPAAPALHLLEDDMKKVVAAAGLDVLTLDPDPVPGTKREVWTALLGVTLFTYQQVPVDEARIRELMAQALRNKSPTKVEI